MALFSIDMSKYEGVSLRKRVRRVEITLRQRLRLAAGLPARKALYFRSFVRVHFEFRLSMELMTQATYKAKPLVGYYRWI